MHWPLIDYDTGEPFIELSLVSRGALDAVLRMPDYAVPLERLLAISPVYDLAHYEVYPLAEMGKPPTA